ncbi:MAG: hypothetical protein JWM04_801 [Verrucomicrobiales bacterium]|nr:hypothetical protein [Verrucomicrobiales bacterium]
MWGLKYFASILKTDAKTAGRVYYGRGLVAILLLLIAIVIASCGPYEKNPQLPMDIVFRNGSLARVYAFGYGTNIVIGKETLSQKIIRHLPAKYRPAGWVSPPHIAQPRPALVFAYGNALADPLATPLMATISVIDENGYGSQSQSTLFRSAIGTNQITPKIFDVFPRRSRKLTFRFYSYQNALLGEVTLPNPHIVGNKPWVAEGLPQERNAWNGVLRLTDVVSGVKFGSTDIPSARERKPVWTVVRGRYEESEFAADWKMKGVPSENTCTLLKFELDSKQGLDRLPQVVSVSSEDASGNLLQGSKIQGRWSGGVYYVWVYECLWPNEPIKYRVELRKYLSATNCVLEFVAQPRTLPLSAGVGDLRPFP